MTNQTASAETNLEKWATATGASADEVAAAWQDLVRRGLASEATGQITLSPLALRRATSDTQRRLAAHLSGYLLTENSFIVRRAGKATGTPGLPCILNTRIAVEQIASYFKDGWGVTEIARDLPFSRRKKSKRRLSITSITAPRLSSTCGATASCTKRARPTLR